MTSKSANRYVPPVEAEQAYYASLGNQDLAAWFPDLKLSKKTRADHYFYRFFISHIAKTPRFWHGVSA